MSQGWNRVHVPALWHLACELMPLLQVSGAITLLLMLHWKWQNENNVRNGKSQSWNSVHVPALLHHACELMPLLQVSGAITLLLSFIGNDKIIKIFRNALNQDFRICLVTSRLRINNLLEEYCGLLYLRGMGMFFHEYKSFYVLLIYLSSSFSEPASVHSTPTPSKTILFHLKQLTE